ncbi:MAG: tRNA uridine(34) 5-carboxymethylaminomethyl modification radical SAM/GNAT enzyme Elp3 [Candidatus Moranbacteria bacterium]|nr:tRNA uridine(34) 5-carboxymethylaminomethyl modification radical SAM/GNAT enzyme Elp3 [Candidatus Moranbacteria bacterium]
MNKQYDNYIISAIESLPESREEFLKLKKRLSAKHGLPIPTNADLRQSYEKLVSDRKISRSEKFEKLLFSKKIRTASGIAAVAVLTKSHPCPGKCTYCPSEKNMPKSYLSNEPAVMRAITAKFDPYRQVQNRLSALELNGHATDKIELIVMGGTFSYLPKAYQKKFIAECFRAANDYPSNIARKKIPRSAGLSAALFKEEKRNERAKHRIIGLTLETRPDYIDEKEIINFRLLGCTRVELGIQSVFDDILTKTRRGHSISATAQATKLLKDAGFKINYHIMPGLPDSTPKRDLEMFSMLFNDERFQPDMLKIYPTVVLAGSELHDIWKRKGYEPLSDNDFEKLIIRIKNDLIPPYVRIARLVRDVPNSSIVAGPIVSNLRQLIANESRCPCIRCREVRENYSIKEEIVLDRINYDASDGKEIFLQYVSPDKKKLFALLRLRIPSDNNITHAITALRNSALIREVHTYGKMTGINKKDTSSPQHIGLGKKLLAEAERIAREEFGLKKIAVISGVGVRSYYRKSGYRLKDTYMVKGI